ncbi:MAG: VWA domain-containing protein [Acidobacteriota bacterium]
MRIISIIIASIYLLALVTPGQAQQKEKPGGEETIRIDTNLVTLPVIASDRQNRYIPDLQREEFSLSEDGVKQEIVFFAAIEEPINVVLMLDTSSSTLEKLGQIQQAANHFVGQLKPADRIKIISFDDEVREQSGFTNDRNELRMAINRAKPGQGTKLYDAVRIAIASLARTAGRKAIVLFTDGVDWQSDDTSAKNNFEEIEESGIIVYPIRFDTRLDTEEMLRNQQEMIGETDLGAIFGAPNSRPRRGTTPTTLPGDGGTPVPTGRRGADDPYRLPVPDIQLPRRRYPNGGPTGVPGGGPAPTPGGLPGGLPGGRFPDERFPDTRNPDPRWPDDTGGSRFPDASAGGGGYPRMPRRQADGTSVMLDRLYRDGYDYLVQMAERSGGRLVRADQLTDVRGAFVKIADELRHQYSLGYYPTKQSRDGRGRKVQGRVERKETVIRTRPGYRARR